MLCEVIRLRRQHITEESTVPHFVRFRPGDCLPFEPLNYRTQVAAKVANELPADDSALYQPTEEEARVDIRLLLGKTLREITFVVPFSLVIGVRSTLLPVPLQFLGPTPRPLAFLKSPALSRGSLGRHRAFLISLPRFHC